MISFFRKAALDSHYFLAKLFATPARRESSESLIALFEHLERLGTVRLSRYSLNSSSPLKYSIDALTQSLKGRSFEEIEEVGAYDDSGRYGLSAFFPFPRARLDKILELQWQLPSLELTSKQLAELTSGALNAGYDVLYGYGRVLPFGIDPTTENRIKRSLLGNLNVTVGGSGGSWCEDPSGIRQGAIKGIYEYNVLSIANLRRDFFRHAVESLGALTTPVGHDISIIQLTSEQLSQLRIAFPARAGCIRIT